MRRRQERTIDQAAYTPAPAAHGWRCWGHHTAVQTLQRAVATAPQQAYIVGGPEHVGKTTLALAFAQALICPCRTHFGAGCGECATCRRVARWVHPDVTRFDLELQALDEKGSGKHTTLTIETVRAVTASLGLRPLEGAWRVVVLDDVETMQRPAQEAFLKTLEEPPPYAVIMMLVSDPDVLLSTVRSRCHEMLLQPVPEATIQSSLEAAGVEPITATELAALSNGLPGWGFRAANDPALRTARAEMQAEAKQWLVETTYARIVRAVLLADQFGRDRGGVCERLDILLGLWRTLLMQRLGVIPAVDAGVDGAVDRLSVARLNIPQMISAVRSVQTCKQDLLANVRPRLAMESMVLSWPTLTGE